MCLQSLVSSSQIIQRLDRILRLVEFYFYFWHVQAKPPQEIVHLVITLLLCMRRKVFSIAITWLKKMEFTGSETSTSSSMAIRLYAARSILLRSLTLVESKATLERFQLLREGSSPTPIQTQNSYSLFDCTTLTVLTNQVTNQGFGVWGLGFGVWGLGFG